MTGLRTEVRMGLLRLGLVLGAALLGGCAASNRYDTLVAVPLERVAETLSKSDAPTPKRPRLGIAFGGGGVRGFMHLGALRALDEAGIRAEVVTGTSAGAIAAALYASGLSHQDIESRLMSVSEFELLDLVFSRQGALNGRALAAWVREVTGGRAMRALPVALGVVVTDLVEGRALLVVEGDPGEAVQASASVPGTVMPVESGNATYVDGGVLTVLPIRFARAMGADLVIAIDIYCGKPLPLRGNAVDTVFRSFRLQSCTLAAVESTEADFLLRPDFEPASAMSFAQRDAAIDAGYQAMKRMLPALRARLLDGS
jgi:NTE family protein